MSGNFWSLMPAIVAIILALATKEVYVSLLVGILGGALFFTNFNLIKSIEVVLGIMSDKVGGNVNILIFLILLGMIVALVQKSGASRAYGEWAARNIKTKRGALAITSFLGVLIFVDDYFNCLTVGTVMRPVTDKHRITRAKLAYIIDSTAAPICILSPISSWAAAVSSSLPEGSNVDGFQLFLKTIPFNIYAISTLVMVIFIIAVNFDFMKMAEYERKNKEADLDKTDADSFIKGARGKIVDLVFPIVLLIVLCIWFMLYTGGILENGNIVTAFADCDATLSLVLGSFFTVIIVALFYIPRKVLKFTDFAASLVDGFKAMVPAILVLSLAWTLSGISGAGYLESGIYVSNLVSSSQISLGLIPVVFFLVAVGLSFATGTSWGTFGILIPIIMAILGETQTELLAISISAVLAGAVAGDHISPISDTTILSSAGAGCEHIEHVSTQLPYAMLVITVSMIGYIVSGLTENGFLGLFLSLLLLVVILFIASGRQKKKMKS